jgi:hypothetical protein
MSDENLRRAHNLFRGKQMRAVLLLIAASPVAALSLGGLAPRSAVRSRATTVQAAVSSAPPAAKAAAPQRSDHRREPMIGF